MKKKSEEHQMKTTIREDGLPADIIFDILVLLPVISLSKFRCVCKLWSSIISSQFFIKSKLKVSSSHPTFVITFPGHRYERLLFSAPAHAQGDKSPLVATHSLTVHGFCPHHISQSINGLMCFGDASRLKICNPITRETIVLPCVPDTTRKMPIPNPACFSSNFFGYDPVEDTHKVLNTTVYASDVLVGDVVMMVNQVLVLGAFTWRMVEDGPPHRPFSDGLSINGTLYYKAYDRMGINHSFMVAFDLHRETFRRFELPMGENFVCDNTAFFDCDGRLGIIFHVEHLNKLYLWILKETYTEVWSERQTFDLHFPWNDVLGKNMLLAGTVYSGEIVISLLCLSNPLRLYLYDLKKNDIQVIEIEGLPDYQLAPGSSAYRPFNRVCFTKHVESILSLSGLY